MRNIVITGGTRGIGAACTRAFVNKGDRVFAVYEKNDDAAQAIAKETGAIVIKADVSVPEDIERVISEIHSYGSVDVLVNNAGISAIKMLCDTTPCEWDRIFAVNAKSAFLMTKAVLSDMVSRKYGKIINISSIWGETGASCEVAYSASKAALIGFTKALSKELAPSGICVNCVSPGLIDTEMNKELSRAELEAVVEEIPLMRMGSTVDVANTVLFLASQNADYITGQVVPVNGGMLI